MTPDNAAEADSLSIRWEGATPQKAAQYRLVANALIVDGWTKQAQP